MPTVAIKITNLPQIQAAFNKAPNLMRSELNTAIKKTIFRIQGKSMANTPVLTGRLRASTASIFSDLRGEVGTHTNYDVFIHEGTRYMKGRPYLRDAVKESDTLIQTDFKEAVQNVLNKIGSQV